MASKQTTVKPWGGRFSRATDKFVEKFTESVSFDWRLYHHDIMGSVAHAQMLVHTGILKETEGKKIIRGLKSIAADIDKGKFEWRVELEDVHMNIEAALVARIGEVGKKLHTGRSRNDQVATDMRLYLRDEVDAIAGQLTAVMSVLLDVAEREASTIMPGYTHLQAAQPVTFGHHMLAWYEMLQRDTQRMGDCRKRINVLPLGAAALAGTSFPIKREYVADLLGFEGVCENSLDAVSDRDFAVEFTACAALIMTHLSRFSEELILWMNPRFGFIDIADRFCTGSSIMPQKKNPDVPELVRGKAGRVNGHLVALLTLMKGQPLAYNKDNQEDKEPLFDSVETLTQTLNIYAEMISGIQVNAEAMRNAALQGYATATDLADYLVKKGLPFRDAHETVAVAVRFAEQRGCELGAISLADLQRFSSHIGEDVYQVLSLEGSIGSRNHIGGTAPNQVEAAIKRARDGLAK